MPSFTTRLEGTLNQIWLNYPRKIVDHEVAFHLKDQFFHGVHIHIRDSIRYLHSNPETTYFQLMVAARKAESKMEDAKEKVRARSSAATEVTDSSKVLGDQLTNRAEQGSHPSTTPNSPMHRGHRRGWMDKNTPAHPSSQNGQTDLGQNTSAHSSSAASRVATASQGRGRYPNTTRCPGQCPKHERPQHSAML